MPEKDMSAEAPKGEAAPRAAAEQLTPEQWAHRKGLFVEAKPPNESHFAWQHTAAATLHGWNAHTHHAGEPIRLSEPDYDAAIKAVDAPGNPKAHKPAMSRYCPHKGGH